MANTTIFSTSQPDQHQVKNTPSHQEEVKKIEWDEYVNTHSIPFITAETEVCKDGFGYDMIIKFGFITGHEPKFLRSAIETAIAVYKEKFDALPEEKKTCNSAGFIYASESMVLKHVSNIIKSALIKHYPSYE